MNIGQLINDATIRGDFSLVAANVQAQFGTPARRYLGAGLLPEVTKTKNAYVERGIRFRTVIANSGPRFGPSQLRGGALIGTMDVRLGNSDVKVTLDGEEYDALIELLDSAADERALASLINFVDVGVNAAMVELNEQQRWQALVNASVVRKGDNGYTETVTYPTFSGLRVNAGGNWSNDAYDPMVDIIAIKNKLAARGRKITAIYMNTSDLMILIGNAKVQARLGYVVVSAGGQIQGQPGFVTPEALNRYMVAQGLPAVQTYDLMYQTALGANYFLPRGAMVFVCETGRDEQIDLGTGQFLPIYNTLGYVAVGRAAGQGTPGRIVQVKFFDDKPPRVVAEGWQETLPVLSEPDAVAVIKGIQ